MFSEKAVIPVPVYTRINSGGNPPFDLLRVTAMSW
jgi:hypothetical protein